MAVTRAFLLNPTDSLRLALQRVSANGEGFAAVVTPDRRLVGTFCDTDGRRALVRGSSLDDEVATVMAPGSARANRLPGAVIVRDGLVVDIVFRPRPPIDVVVMAGGKGTRLRALTGTVPKPLLSLGGATILERILTNLATAGAYDTWLSVGYKAGLFRKRIRNGKQLGLSVRYLKEPKPLGNAGALALLPKAGADTIFVTNADLVTDLDYARLFDFHRAHDGPVTMAVTEFTTQVKYGVVHTKNGKVDRFEEKPALTFLGNAGMYVIDREVLGCVPRDTFFQMTDVMDAVRAAGGAVHVFPLYEKWVDAGSPEEFQQVLVEFATGVQS